MSKHLFDFTGHLFRRSVRTVLLVHPSCRMSTKSIHSLKMLQTKAIPRKGNCHLTISLIYHSEWGCLQVGDPPAKSHLCGKPRLNKTMPQLKWQLIKVPVDWWEEKSTSLSESNFTLALLLNWFFPWSVANGSMRKFLILASVLSQLQHLGSPKPGVRTHSYLLPNSFLMKWYFDTLRAVILLMEDILHLFTI